MELADALRKAVPIANRLDPARFSLFLEKVADKLPSNSSDALFSAEEREKLLIAFAVSPSELTALTSLTSSILLQAGFHSLKSTKLSEELAELGFLESVADCFLGVWSSKGPLIVSRLKQASVSPNQLDWVNYSLNVEVAAGNRLKLNRPSADVQLVLRDGNKLNMELTHGELSRLYAKLEDAQKSLDALMS